jgi:hypothetical protein
VDIRKILHYQKLFSNNSIIDIETMNKITQVTPNFKEFLKQIKSDLTTKEIRKEKYDKIYDIDDLINGKGLK